MEDNTTTASTQAEETSQSQADATQADNASQAEAASETISLEEAKKLRSEAKGLRERAKKAEDALKGFEDAKLSESEKAQKRLETLTTSNSRHETSVKKLLLERKIGVIGKEMGLRASASVSRLLNADALEFDLDNLEVSGVEDQLKALKKSDPDLFFNGGTNGGRGGAGHSSANMNDIIRGRMGR